MDKDILTVLKIVIITTLLCIFFTVASKAESAPTGKSMICQKNDWLSSDCMNVEVPEMKYYDKDVAMEDAKTEKTISNTVNNMTVVKPSESKESEVSVKSFIEYDDSFKGSSKGYDREEYYKNSKR